ncbi:MAG: ABC transporter permease subunit [Candidatus Methanomethylicia archaeon]
MVSKSLNLIIKEVKDLLRDPKILIGMILIPLIMFPVIGLAIRISMESSIELYPKSTIAIVDLDDGKFSNLIIETLKNTPNINLVEINTISISNVLARSMELNTSVLIIIPKGFTLNITLGQNGFIHVFSIIREINIASTGVSGVLGSIIDIIEKTVSYRIISELVSNRNPETVMKPIVVSYSTVFRGEVLDINPQVVLGLLISQSTMLPVAILIILIFAVQIAATSIAIEKEQKTLETLLTLPVGRLTILGSKLIGSSIIAALGSISYMIGFRYYMSSFMEYAPEQLNIPILFPSLSFHVVIGLLIFITLVASLALAIIIAVFAEDVRSAQTLVGYMIPLIIIPGIIAMFSDMNALPLTVKILMYAIPFSYPMIATRSGLIGDYSIAYAGIIYITVFTLVILYVAARLFTTERILTARISLRRDRSSGNL